MASPRFKIDVASYGCWVRVSRARKKWHSFITGAVAWDRLDIFGTREEAREFYEKIKDLPEYLD